MSSHIVSTKFYFLIWGSLLALLLLTWGAARFDLGPANTIVAMLIAVTKMLLVVLFFMHVRYNPRITWLFVAAGFAWLTIMITFTMTDYLTRQPVRPYNNAIPVARDIGQKL